MRLIWGVMFVGGAMALGNGVSRAQPVGGNPAPRAAAAAAADSGVVAASSVTPPAAPGDGRPTYAPVPPPVRRVPIWRRVLNYFSDDSDDSATSAFVRDPSTGRTVSAIGQSTTRPPR